jgi:hypothetical protein
MADYSLALFAHVLIVIYLLGADLGRLYLVRLGAAGNVGPESRRLAAKGVLWVGSVTNLALILILPAGITLGSALGVYRILHPAYFVGTWIVAGVWALVTILADRLDSRPLHIADIVLRLILAPGFIYDGAIVFAGTSETVDAKWLASKIALYGLLIFLSVPLRWLGFSLRTAMVADDPPGIQAALSKMSLPILSGWAIILLATWFGVAKPF